MSAMPSAEAVLGQHRNELLSYPNVNGVGIGEDILPDGTTKEFIQVYVTQMVTPEGNDVSQVVPSTLDGVEVRVREIGEISPI